MIQYIKSKNKVLSIIIRASFNEEGIKFFTPDDFSQQLGYMKRIKGYKIDPHLHNSVKREVSFTKEVLFIKSGKVRVDFYEPDKKYFLSKILTKGDVILLAFGGHGFEILEKSEIIEVKQGPYSLSKDKIKFSNTLESNIRIRK